MPVQVQVDGLDDLRRTFRELTPKLQRQALRDSVKSAAQLMVRQVRTNISQMVSEDAASRGGKIRRSRHSGAKTSLKKSIGWRAWSVPHKGIIGAVVGPRWPEGAHGHLVEFGHRIVPTRKQAAATPSLRFIGRGRGFTRHTRPIPFQRKAGTDVRWQVVGIMRRSFQAWVAKQRKKGVL